MQRQQDARSGGEMVSVIVRSGLRLYPAPGKLSAAIVGLGLALALWLSSGPGFAATHASVSTEIKSAAKTGDTGKPEKQRPFSFTFPGGMTTSPKDSNVYILHGTPGHPGTGVSRDTTVTMMTFAWNPKTKIGVGTGDPHLDDPHNSMTADKLTIMDAGTPDQRKAIFDGHVHIIHHPDSETDPENQSQFGEIFTHDVVLTCDHAEYYYRLKTGSATGHLLMVGQDKQNGKPVKADLTADRLEFEDKNNVYRAIGSVLIHDGDTTVTTPELDTVAAMRDGKRQVQSVTMAGPVEGTGLFDDSDESDTTAAAVTPAAGAVKGSGTPGTPTDTGNPAKPSPPTGTGGAGPAAPPPTTTPPAPNPTTPAPESGGGAPAKAVAKGTGGT